jgi:hypothetical protein
VWSRSSTHSTADDFEIREYALDGELVRQIRWQGRELAISPAEIERYKSWVTEAQEVDPQSRWAQELIKMEFPPTMPAYDTMMLDEAGNLWVRRFALPGIREDDWDVFSPEGAWQGTVAARSDPCTRVLVERLSLVVREYGVERRPCARPGPGIGDPAPDESDVRPTVLQTHRVTGGRRRSG